MTHFRSGYGLVGMAIINVIAAIVCVGFPLTIAISNPRLFPYTGTSLLLGTAFFVLSLWSFLFQIVFWMDISLDDDGKASFLVWRGIVKHGSIQISQIRDIVHRRRNLVRIEGIGFRPIHVLSTSQLPLFLSHLEECRRNINNG